jgi:hypothetical protein
LSHQTRATDSWPDTETQGYAIAEEAVTLRIVVEAGNTVARSFYKCSGFVPVEDELFELVLPQLG